MSEATVTPNAIDEYVPVEWIRVVGRHRRDMGDIEELASSIADVGLLNPVTLTRDGQLVAGERRLAACRRLGWPSVPARFVDNLHEASQLLHAERDENTCRKAMLPSELASLGASLYEIEKPAAAERQRKAGQITGRANGRTNAQGTRTPSISESPDDAHVGKTTELVGKALGLSGRTYQELRYAHGVANNESLSDEDRQLARQTLAEMDRNGGISRPARRLRRRMHARQDVREAVEAAMAGEEPEPVPASGRTAAANAARYARLRELAETGHTSAQIAELLGYASAETVRKTAKEQGITIKADAVMFRARKIDSDRIVRETVTALEGLAIGVGLVVAEELDRNEVEGWANSLSGSIRVLNRLVRQMKEIAQ